ADLGKARKLRARSVGFFMQDADARWLFAPGGAVPIIFLDAACGRNRDSGPAAAAGAASILEVVNESLIRARARGVGAGKAARVERRVTGARGESECRCSQTRRASICYRVRVADDRLFKFHLNVGVRGQTDVCRQLYVRHDSKRCGVEMSRHRSVI